MSSKKKKKTTNNKSKINIMSECEESRGNMLLTEVVSG